MSELTGNTEIRMGSERSFGVVFAIVFTLIAVFPLMRGGDMRWWALAVAGAFLCVGLVRSDLLRPLNRLWFRFGLLLNKVVSPIVMGILFFLTVTPVGLLVRMRNGDLLHQKLDRKSLSYWIEVDREKAAQSSMKKQF